MRSTRSVLLAASALALLGGLGAAAQAMPAPRKGGNRDCKPTVPRLDTALQREIAEHNEAVERRKSDKKARKLAHGIKELK